MKRIIASLALMSIFSVGIGDEKAGEVIYNHYCVTCHSGSLPQSPVAHDQRAWGERLAAAVDQARKENPNIKPEELANKAVDVLVATVKNGKGAMPPGGACPPDKCKSDDDYKSAIEFMISKPESD